MKKIDSLIAEQEALLPVYTEKWLDIGLSTEPTSYDGVVDAAARAYAEAGLKAPRVELFPSPFALKEAAKKYIGDEPIRWFFGQHEAPWFGWYDYLYEACHLQYIEKMHGLSGLVQHGGWGVMLDDVYLCAERTSAVVMNAEHICHNPHRQAISYPDGNGVYILNGIRMEEWMVMTSADELTGSRILGVSNVDQRREIIRRLGIERVLEKIPHTVLETTHDGMYSLLECDLTPSHSAAKFLKMRNPSIGVWHVEGVHPDCRTVQQAINWRAGTVIGAGVPWQPTTLT